MSGGPVDGPLPLVPQELRGYRRFRLAGGNLMPTVYTACGPWRAGTEHAICAHGGEHDVPDPECGCGLYGWYHPSRATNVSGFGDVQAVIAARGRTILGDHGFRSAGARIDAVAVPARLRARPGAAGRASRAISERYPGTAVYRSRRAMLRDYPPDDLGDLGITVTAGKRSRSGRWALAVWAAGVILLCSVALLAPGAVAGARPVAWGSALGGLVVWQALLIWLAGRCSKGERRPPPG